MLKNLQWNGPTLAHKIYDADLAFGPNVSNDVVYERTVVANDVSAALRKTIICGVYDLSDAQPCFVRRYWMCCCIWADRIRQNIHNGML